MNKCLTCGQDRANHTRPHTLLEIIGQLRFRISECGPPETFCMPIDGPDIIDLLEKIESEMIQRDCQREDIDAHTEAYAERVEEYREMEEQHLQDLRNKTSKQE